MKNRQKQEAELLKGYKREELYDGILVPLLKGEGVNCDADNFFSWTVAHVHSLDSSETFSFTGHEYLREPYTDEHPNMTFEKASQMCVSTRAILHAVYVCDKHRMNTVYFFPTDKDVSSFSDTRIRPMIQMNDYLASCIGETDSKNVKQIRNVFLYMRGMKSATSKLSIPAGYLVLDEMDQMGSRDIEIAKKRLSHSKEQWIQKLSTPTIPDYGVNREFQLTDQRYWTLKCPHCGTWNVTEDEFPNCLQRVSPTKVILVCKNPACRGELDTQAGEWVAKYPRNTEARGYHITSLYSTRANLSDILTEFERRRNLSVFYNHRLGIAYVDAKNRLSREQIAACCQNYSIPMLARRTFMGVDQGNHLHVHIVVREPSGRLRTVYLNTLIGDNEYDAGFTKLDALMKDYDVHTCVIDANPNTHDAKAFSDRFRSMMNTGRVFRNYSQEGIKTEPVWDKEEGVVRTNKTLVLDSAYNAVIAQELILPSQEYEDVREFIKHGYNTVKKEEEDEETGDKKWEYVRTDDDHYWRAFGYALTASEHAGGFGTFADVAAITGGKGFGRSEGGYMSGNLGD